MNYGLSLGYGYCMLTVYVNSKILDRINYTPNWQIRKNLLGNKDTVGLHITISTNKEVILIFLFKMEYKLYREHVDGFCFECSNVKHQS